MEHLAKLDFYSIVLKISFLFIIFVGCKNTISDKNNDDPLDGYLKIIENSVSKEKLNEFKNQIEDDAILYALENNWLAYLNGFEYEDLLDYFKELNIERRIYISNIVFRSLHRKLSNKPIDIDDQLKFFYKEIEKQKLLQLVNSKRANLYYSKYRIDDTIIVRMPILDGKNAVQYEHPENSNWVYDDTKDLLIKGVIKDVFEELHEKEIIKYFKIRILSKNNDNIRIFSKDINVDDDLEIELRHSIIESPSNGGN